MTKKFRLEEKDHGEIKISRIGTVEDIVFYLKENPELIDWVLSENPEAELPDLENIETIRDLRYELEKINLGWWTLEVNDI